MKDNNDIILKLYIIGTYGDEREKKLLLIKKLKREFLGFVKTLKKRRLTKKLKAVISVWQKSDTHFH